MAMHTVSNALMIQTRDTLAVIANRARLNDVETALLNGARELLHKIEANPLTYGIEVK